MDTNFDWIAEYYQWIKKNLSARNLKNGWTEIGTPFMDRHNDGLVIYAKRDGDAITLSDDGYIINDLLLPTESLCAVLNEPSFWINFFFLMASKIKTMR